MTSLGLRDPAFLASVTPAAGGGGLPATYSNLVLWLKADSFSLPDGTAIGDGGNEWEDQSVELNQATSSGTTRPVFKTNIVGSMPVIRFDGVNDAMALADALQLVGDYTVMLVGAVTAPSIFLGHSSLSARLLGNFISSVNRICINDGTNGLANSANFASAQTDFRLMSWRRSGTTVSVLENKTDRGSGPYTVVNLDLDRIGTATGSSELWTGDIAEILVYEAYRDDTDLADLYDNYLQARWGLP